MVIGVTTAGERDILGIWAGGAGSGVNSTRKIVRSAGSRTASDIVRTLFGRGRLPEQDLDDVKNGKDVLVVIHIDPEGASPARRYVAMGATAAARDDIEAVLGEAPTECSEPGKSRRGR